MGGRRFKNKGSGQPTQFKPQLPPAAALARVEASFSGPLPPPSMLAKYNEALPNGAERVVAMAERQSAHREQLETSVINANIESQKRGSWFAFIICMTAIIGGVYLIAVGKNGYGLASIIGSLATLAGVFFFGKRKEEKELREKSHALDERISHSRGPFE